MKKVAKDSEAIAAALNINWVEKIFSALGFSLLGWLISLLQSLIVVIIIIIAICTVLSCVKLMITWFVSVVKYAPLELIQITDVPLEL